MPRPAIHFFSEIEKEKAAPSLIGATALCARAVR